MSLIRPTGAGMPSMLRINGQEISPVRTPSIEGPPPAGGKPASQKPLPGPADTSAQMEQMFDDADDATIRGENAALMLQGKKPGAKRSLKKKRKDGSLQGDHKRIDGVFPDGDPHNKQESAFQEAAEFEEKVKDTDLSFSRKAGQVEVSAQVFRTDIDEGRGGMVAGESTREIHFASPPLLGDDEVTAVSSRAPSVSVSFQPMDRNDETVPNIEAPMSSETDLRKMLGLKKR